MRDKERVRTWKLVFHKAEEIAERHPKFWLDVQSVAEQGTRKGKGWQRDEGYKGGYKGENKGKEGYKGKDWEKGGYKGGYKGNGKYKGYQGNPQNPQNPFVAPAQANLERQRGWGPALQAAALAAAAAAAAGAAHPQVAAAAAQPGDVRVRDELKGVGKGQKGQIPVTPQKNVGWSDWSVGQANREWQNWGEDQGPRPPKPGGPQGYGT